ncbi:MAG TPA: hypothetical protein VE866_11540 [Candidatus Binatia bacterium]|nr:hypothetical protein [Candidatus Binatia bacterium]
MKAKLPVILLLAFAALHFASAKSTHFHYTFLLPDNYVGWVQIIFNDPQASPLHMRKDKGLEIEVQESGIARTSGLRVNDIASKDEFYYRSHLPNGTTRLVPVPSNFVMTSFSHGGFGVMDTGGKGAGYSSFIFIGPPELRAKVPLADWDKVVNEWSRAHGGNRRVEAPDQYPAPGRIASR